MVDDNQESVEMEAMAEPQVKEMSQYHIDKIVKKAKEKAAENARKEAQAEYEQKLAQLQSAKEAQIASQQQARNQEVPREYDEDAIYQRLQEQFNRDAEQRRLEQEMNQVATNYLSKLNSAKGDYEDFEKITADFDPASFPQLTFLLAGIENAGHVVYELAKNPSKLATLDTLAHKSPKLAHNELVKMAASIANNRDAMQQEQQAQVNEPLDRLNASKNIGSNGKMSVSELRNQPWLRG